MSRTRTIMKLLKDGASHCHDVADEIGVTPHLASSFLSEMYRRGIIKRSGKKVKYSDEMYKCWLYYR